MLRIPATLAVSPARAQPDIRASPALMASDLVNQLRTCHGQRPGVTQQGDPCRIHATWISGCVNSTDALLQPGSDAAKANRRAAVTGFVNPKDPQRVWREPAVPNSRRTADINDDASVHGGGLAMLLAAWGACG